VSSKKIDLKEYIDDVSPGNSRAMPSNTEDGFFGGLRNTPEVCPYCFSEEPFLRRRKGYICRECKEVVIRSE